MKFNYFLTITFLVAARGIISHSRSQDNLGPILEIGTPGATSYIEGREPEYAFQNLDDINRFWKSKEGMPQSIWMRYPTAHTVVKIGFTPRWNDVAPNRFDVDGSPDCADPWTTLLQVESSGFPNNYNNSGFKSWTVPEENRRSFHCIRLNIQSIHLADQGVCLKNLTLWEEQDLGVDLLENLEAKPNATEDFKPWMKTLLDAKLDAKFDPLTEKVGELATKLNATQNFKPWMKKLLDAKFDPLTDKVGEVATKLNATEKIKPWMKKLLDAKFDPLTEKVGELATKLNALENFKPWLKQLMDAKFDSLIDKLEELAADVKPHDPLAPPRLIVKRGTAGASSRHYMKSEFSPRGAFDGTQDWINRVNEFPAVIWMRFQSAHRLQKIGFTAALVEDNLPNEFEVVGSDDCSRWTVLLRLDNRGGFEKDNEFKTFVIPVENRVSFKCLGLRFPDRKGCNGYVRVGRITMYEQA